MTMPKNVPCFLSKVEEIWDEGSTTEERIVFRYFSQFFLTAFMFMY